MASSFIKIGDLVYCKLRPEINYWLVAESNTSYLIGVHYPSDGKGAIYRTFSLKDVSVIPNVGFQRLHVLGDSFVDKPFYKIDDRVRLQDNYPMDNVNCDVIWRICGRTFNYDHSRYEYNLVAVIPPSDDGKPFNVLRIFDVEGNLLQKA